MLSGLELGVISAGSIFVVQHEAVLQSLQDEQPFSRRQGLSGVGCVVLGLLWLVLVLLLVTLFRATSLLLEAVCSISELTSWEVGAASRHELTMVLECYVTVVRK